MARLGRFNPRPAPRLGATRLKRPVDMLRKVYFPGNIAIMGEETERQQR